MPHTVVFNTSVPLDSLRQVFEYAAAYQLQVAALSLQVCGGSWWGNPQAPPGGLLAYGLDYDHPLPLAQPEGEVTGCNLSAQYNPAQRRERMRNLGRRVLLARPGDSAEIRFLSDAIQRL